MFVCGGSECQTGPIMAEAMSGDSFFSMVDLFILSAAGGFAIYWFFVRNKKQQQPTFKKLTVT